MGPMEGHEPLIPKEYVHYDLHVWLFKDNPLGMFAPTNPNVRCEGYDFSLLEKPNAWAITSLCPLLAQSRQPPVLPCTLCCSSTRSFGSRTLTVPREHRSDELPSGSSLGLVQGCLSVPQSRHP
jgi:hypothetical protein